MMKRAFHLLLRLQWLLPLLLMAFSIVLVVAILFYEWHRETQYLERNAEELVTLHMAHLQDTLTRSLSSGDHLAAQQAVVWLASVPAIASLLAVNESQRVVAAIQPAWNGRPVESLAVGYDPLLATRSQQEARGLLLFNPQRTELTAYYPLDIGRPAQNARHVPHGCLFMRYDLTQRQALLRSNLLTTSFLAISLMILGILGLGLFLHLLLNRRIYRLVTAAWQLATGNSRARVNLPGTDELAELGNVFNHMAQRLEENHAQLLRRNRLYDALSETNQTIIRLRTRHELFEAICRIVVEQGGLEVAWIGLLEPAADPAAPRLQVEAVYGKLCQLTPGLQLTLSVDRSLFQTGKAQYFKISAGESGLLCEMPAACHHQIQAAAVFPLYEEEVLIGTFHLCAKDADFFSRDLCELLEEMVGDIGYALNNLIREQRRDQAETALRYERRLLSRILDTIPVMITRYGPSCALQSVNKEFERLVGWGNADLSTLDLMAACYPDAEVQAQVLAHIREAESGWKDFALMTVTGQPLDSSWANIRLEDSSYVGIGIDLTERKQAEHALRTSEATLLSILKAAPVGIGLLMEEVFCWVSEEMLEMTGYSGTELIHVNTRFLYETDQEYQQISQAYQHLQGTAMAALDTRWRCKNGHIIDVHLRFTPLDPDDSQVGMTCAALDISERKRAELHIQHLAYYDGLTDLPNRRLLAEHAKKNLTYAQRHQRPLALLYLDLDRFKEVNDTLGHDVGDLLLIEVGKRLKHCLRDSDTLARLGGDEFAFLLVDSDLQQAKQVAKRVLDSLRQPFILANQTLHIGGSIGITGYPKDGHDLEVLSRHADIAMYQAKSQRLGYAFFEQSQSLQLERQAQLERSLPEALKQQQLVLHYQPIVALDSGQILAVEALVRWQHPQDGLIPPAIFIPIAEKMGLIRRLDQWVLDTALAQAQHWQAAGVSIKIAVNLSAGELQDSRLVGQIHEALQSSGFASHQLTLEMTEAAVMNLANRGALHALHALGLNLSIDNFGNGLSSLSHLPTLPVRHLKIDARFVQAMQHHDDLFSPSVRVVKTILTLAAALDLTVIAEGVQTLAQQQILLSLGCTQAQGFLYSRALPAENVTPLLLGGYLTPVPVNRHASH